MVIKSHRGCLLRVGRVDFILCKQLQVRLTLGERFGVCEPAAFGVYAVCRGFPLDRKGKERRKKAKSATRLSVQEGLLADVIFKYAALIAPLCSGRGRGDLRHLFSSQLKLYCLQPGFPSCKPGRSVSRKQEGKAGLAGLIMTIFHNICWMLWNERLRKLSI